ncbi:MAG: type II toxin-antitoxin system RelE/ParE family toxin [Bacteroidota bacterium]
MASYSLSTRAQFDLVGIYKYGIRYFGQNQATTYLHELERFLLELSNRQELAKDATFISNALKYYNFRAHVIFYLFDDNGEIYAVRVLGKRMNFIEHL